MPHLTDKNEIRTRLRRDPAWSVYALCDLAPAMFSKTVWFTPDLTLLVRDYGTAILFAIGPGSVGEALECAGGPVHLQVQRDALDEAARHAAVSSPRLMWRMTWTGDRVASPAAVTRRLDARDVPALQALYADGQASGESPDFFFPSASRVTANSTKRWRCPEISAQYTSGRFVAPQRESRIRMSGPWRSPCS